MKEDVLQGIKFMQKVKCLGMMKLQLTPSKKQENNFQKGYHYRFSMSREVMCTRCEKYCYDAILQERVETKH